MECLVLGANFLLRVIREEVFAYKKGRKFFISLKNKKDIFPYLLVNIGSGVSIVKVERTGGHVRVSGSSLGGGTFWGLCRLLTGIIDFEEMLKLSVKGDNSKVDVLVGDIYGGTHYSRIGLSANTIACSFGKVVGESKDLIEYSPADVALALMRMISYNIGHLAYLNAIHFGIKNIFFGGYFIRANPYSMETISFAISFWSKDNMLAFFQRHEGFLGAIGAFLQCSILTNGSENKIFDSTAFLNMSNSIQKISHNCCLEDQQIWLELYLEANASTVDL